MKRGEIRGGKLNPARGREVGEIRPEFKLWRVTIGARDRLKETCQLILDQPRTLDRARLGEGPLITLKQDEMESVEYGLRVVAST